MRKSTIIAIIGIACLAAPGVSVIAHLFARNQIALQTRDICFGEKPASYLRVNETDIPPLDAWFIALQAHCLGDFEKERSAWEVELTKSENRMSILQAFHPDNLDLARLATQLQPTSAFAWLWLGDILTEQGDSKSAIQAYQNGLRYSPSDGLTWRKLGDLYLLEGDWQTAVKAYDQACNYVDRGKNGCYRAGLLYLEHAQYELAADRFRRSIRQIPYFLPSKKGLAKALINLGKTEEALPYLETLAESGDAEAQQMLQDLHFDQ